MIVNHGLHVAGGKLPALQGAKAESIDLLISWTLRIGVGISLALVCLGTAVTFLHHPDYLRQQSSLALTHPQGNVPHGVGDMVKLLRHCQGQGVVTLGLLVLIATPIMRVALSTLLFWHEKDRAFTTITLVVLMLLIASLCLGRAGG